MRRLVFLKDKELISVFTNSLKNNKTTLMGLSYRLSLPTYSFIHSNKRHSLPKEKRNNIIKAIVYMNNHPHSPNNYKIKTVEEYIKKVGIVKLPPAKAEGSYYSKELECYL